MTKSIKQIRTQAEIQQQVHDLRKKSVHHFHRAGELHREGGGSWEDSKTPKNHKEISKHLDHANRYLNQANRLQKKLVAPEKPRRITWSDLGHPEYDN